MTRASVVLQLESRPIDYPVVTGAELSLRQSRRDCRRLIDQMPKRQALVLGLVGSQSHHHLPPLPMVEVLASRYPTQKDWNLRRQISDLR